MPEVTPLSRSHMPTDFSISMDTYVGRSGFGGGYIDGEPRVPDSYAPQQSLQGFESTYQNIIDYIVRITYKIWEERDVEYIGRCYSDDSSVFDDYGLQFGNKKIIADTHHTTGAFSNIKLIADEIVWAGDDDVGFRTSHRTIIRGTNDGDSKYGPATNKDVDVLVIANCVALGNDIFLEHVLYNNSSLLIQLGFDLNEVAARMAEAPPAGWPRADDTWQLLRTAGGPVKPISVSEPLSGFDVDRFARHCLDRLWNKRDYSVLETDYVAGFQFEGATERKFTGPADYIDMLNGMHRAFPDLELQVDEVYWMGNDRDGYLTSERWSATGTHSGDGIFGPASGVEVQIWGITQHRIADGHIVREWMLFNELDLMMQIARSLT